MGLTAEILHRWKQHKTCLQLAPASLAFVPCKSSRKELGWKFLGEVLRKSPLPPSLPLRFGICGVWRTWSSKAALLPFSGCYWCFSNSRSLKEHFPLWQNNTWMWYRMRDLVLCSLLVAGIVVKTLLDLLTWLFLILFLTFSPVSSANRFHSCPSHSLSTAQSTEGVTCHSCCFTVLW